MCVCFSTADPWYVKLFQGLEVLQDLAQDGYIIALQQQINTIFQVLAAHGFITGYQQVSGLGSLMLGVSGKFQTAANVLDVIGDNVSCLEGVCDSISTPLQNAADYIQQYQKVFDGVKYMKIPENTPRAITQVIQQTAEHSADITKELLPRASKIIMPASRVAA